MSYIHALRQLRLKPNQAILLGILLFTFLNVYFALKSPTYHELDFSNSISGGGNSFLKKLQIFTPSSLPKNADHAFVGYHHDDDTNLVVLQKYFLNEDMAEDKVHHLWNFLNSDLKADKDSMDLKIVNGYDYKEYLKSLTEGLKIDFNHTFVDHYKTEMKFTATFRKFFEDLQTLLEDCNPGISAINNDAHYPNGDKILKKYAEKKRKSEEEMKTVNIPRTVHNKGRLPIYGGHLREGYRDEMVRTQDMLSMYLTLEQNEIDALKESHSKFMKKMDKDWPKELLDYNTFNDFMKGDGIVYLGGGKYDQLVFLSVKLLRDHGSRLPVEVIVLKKEEYNVDFCDRILPTLNGRCKLMTDYIPQSFFDTILENAKKLSEGRSDEDPHMDPMMALGYQLKNMAIFISSFERILYLDADNLPIRNPDILFQNKPFTDHHMILWPDLWRRSTSPTFYEITGQSIDPKHRVRNSYAKGDGRGMSNDYKEYSFHDTKGTIPEASSETGQFMLNKRVHFKTLMLSMYYNYYGPLFYYPLLSQGAAGEGDKETFIAAAHRLGLPYYQVTEFNREFGPIDKNSKKHEFYGMGQYNPIVDYLQKHPNDPDYPNQSVRSKKIKALSDSHYVATPPDSLAQHDEDKTVYNYDYHYFKSSSLFFLHANWPKLYIESLFLTDERGPVDPVTKLRRRLYGVEFKNELGGDYDFELKIMEQIWWCFCDEPMVDFSGIPAPKTETRKKICRAVDMQRKFLQNG